MVDTRPWRHLYKTAAWQRLRGSQLAQEPLCRYCSEMGRTTAATVCDHIEPHKGDEALFFDPCNLQSLCKQCHDSVKQREEHLGVRIGADASGYPLDPKHHWNAEGGSVKNHRQGEGRGKSSEAEALGPAWAPSFLANSLG